MHELHRRQVMQALLGCGLTLVGGSHAVAASARPRRIVSIGGALTEIIYALGAQRDLVGVDTTSLFPAAATALPSVGYARALSSEGILALAPTVVVTTEDAGPPAVLKQVAGAGVPVTTLAAHHQFEGMLDRIDRLGRIVDKQVAAQRLRTNLMAEWQSVGKAVAARKGPPPKVLFVLSNSPSQIMVGGQGTTAEAMIVYAGARNAAQGVEGYKPLSTEALIAAQPDVILFTDQGLEAIGGLDAGLKIPGVSQTPAGRLRRVVSMETMFLLGFGPRMPAAVAALHRELGKVVVS